MRLNALTSAVIASIGILGVAPALADNAWNCAALTFQGGAVNDEQCVGSFDPPPADLGRVNAAFAGDPTYVVFAKDDNSSAGASTTGVIDAWGTGNGQGAITFNTALTDSFVLELKFGQEWSLFRFDDDVTAGTTWTFALPDAPNLRGLGLSHASVSTVAPVPEPQTYALMLAGLAALAFVVRRRRT